MTRPRSDRLQQLRGFTHNGAHWLAWMAGGKLAELQIERAGQTSLVGNIYRGRVRRVDRALGAAFIDIGTEQAGFLPLSELAGRIAEGDALVVQIARDARGEKGPRMTARPSLAGRLLILVPDGRGVTIAERIADEDERRRLTELVSTIADPLEGIVVRSAAEGAHRAALAHDAEGLRRVWRAVLQRAAVVDPPCLLHQELGTLHRLVRDHGSLFDAVVLDGRRRVEELHAWASIEAPQLAPRIRYEREGDWAALAEEIRDQAADALEPRVRLPSGGLLLFEPGETLTAIDVDSARQTLGDGGKDAEHSRLSTNLEAAAEIARQIRLRNLGGIIVIDFIDLRDAAARRRLVAELRAATAEDPTPCWVGSMSRLGLVEMTRRRRGRPLAEQMLQTCPTCDGSGYTVLPETE